MKKKAFIKALYSFPIMLFLFALLGVLKPENMVGIIAACLVTAIAVYAVSNSSSSAPERCLNADEEKKPKEVLDVIATLHLIIEHNRNVAALCQNTPLFQNLIKIAQACETILEIWNIEPQKVECNKYLRRYILEYRALDKYLEHYLALTNTHTKHMDTVKAKIEAQFAQLAEKIVAVLDDIFLSDPYVLEGSMNSIERIFAETCNKDFEIK